MGSFMTLVVVRPSFCTIDVKDIHENASELSLRALESDVKEGSV